MDRGQEIPSVVPFHCLNMKPDGILGNRDGLQFGLDQFRMCLKEGKGIDREEYSHSTSHSFSISYMI